MVRMESVRIEISELNKQIKGDVEYPDTIQVAPDFQRGDDENGVWSRDKNKKYIDSLRKNYPTGIITLVKDHSHSKEPWMVLDGGNRCRAIRDFLDNKFDDHEKQFFEDLSERTKARFEARLVCVQRLQIESTDPSSTIATMFSRLNMSSTPLKHGELIKAHGWKGNTQIIELAKAIIGDTWKTKDVSQFNRRKLLLLTKEWAKVFGKLGEQKRCDTLAMMTGFIISATKNKFKLFDKSYSILTKHIDDCVTDTDLDVFYERMSTFLRIMRVYEATLFGQCRKGMPSKKRIAPVWKPICEGTMCRELEATMIRFYQACKEEKNRALFTKYMNRLSEGGDNHTTDKKVDSAIEVIKQWGTAVEAASI
jgi:hypothetical protein